MHISQVIFNMPQDVMHRHLTDFANGVKKKFQDVGEDAASAIAKKMKEVLSTWPEEGEAHIDEFGDVLLWAMIEVLFGPVASKKQNPHLPDEFNKIDDHLFVMLRSGKVEAKVRE